MNKVIVIGNVGNANANENVFKFSVATTESWKDKTGEKKEKTEWHNIVVFGTYGQTLSKIISKGSKVAVEGKLSTSSYEKEGVKHYSTSIVATNVEALTPKSASNNDETIPF